MGVGLGGDLLSPKQEVTYHQQGSISAVASPVLSCGGLAGLFGGLDGMGLCNVVV